jgi:hypothetical protein
MSKNSTLKLWDLLSNQEYYSFDKIMNNITSVKKIEPKKETIKNILAYAKTVRAVKMKSADRILISLN